MDWILIARELAGCQQGTGLASPMKVLSAYWDTSYALFSLTQHSVKINLLKLFDATKASPVYKRAECLGKAQRAFDVRDVLR